MPNEYRRKVCAGCGKFRNLAWDTERRLCHDCLVVESYRTSIAEREGNENDRE